jgi:hypothetical protein
VVEALIEAGAEVNKADNNSADRGLCGRQ